MANPVFDAVRTVLAVREFDDRPLPDGALGRIVEAARLTASASNRQPWHFVAVHDRADLEALGRLVKTGPYVKDAAAAVIVGIDRSNPLAISDASRAIQSMILVAWDEGVGSNWTGYAGRLDEVRRTFGLPDEYDVLAVLPFGYPKRKLGRGKKNRRPVSEVISDGRFGTSWKD